MKHLSIHDTFVIEQVVSWLAASGEVLVELYDPRSAGGGFWYLITSLADFNDMAAKARSKARFSVFRQPQFPTRGIVDDSFIAHALDATPDGTWYAIVPLEFYPALLGYLGNGNSHAELKAELEECRGQFVCLGKDPDPPTYSLVIDGQWEVLVAQKP
jgi:hypothetical protein